MLGIAGWGFGGEEEQGMKGAGDTFVGVPQGYLTIAKAEVVGVLPNGYESLGASWTLGENV